VWVHKHNYYDLLKESRSYHAKEANDELEKSSTLRNYELYSKMLKLLVKMSSAIKS
jgi:GTP cyclohydrolase II